MGGSTGGTAIALAIGHPHLNFIVQDLPAVLEGVEDTLPADLSPHVKARIQFQPYSFLDEQTVKNADIYLFRQVFHNWPDKYCVTILQNLVPALKPGAKIVVNGYIMPESGDMTSAVEKTFR